MNKFIIRDKFIPFALPDITELEINNVTDALRGGWIAKGPRTVEFERRFAEYAGAGYAVATNSCTAALFLALFCAGIGPGDEVLVPSMTFAASVNTVVHNGAAPVFVDIDETGCMDPGKAEEKITERTKAIVPVHYGGAACDLDKIYALADKYGLFVSEDAAHAVYTRYKSRPVGSGTRGAASFSFYANKNLSTGEGGMLLTDALALSERAGVLVTHGMSSNAWRRYMPGSSWRYDIIEPGYKYNMCDIQAALGLAQLSRLDGMQARRARIAERYNAAFGEMEQLTIPVIPEYTTTPSWHLYVLRLKPDTLSIGRDGFKEELTQKNVGTSVHYTPVHMMSAYKHKYGCAEGDLPVTEAWYDSIVSLPIYPKMTDEETDYVIEAVADTVEKHKK